MSAWLHCTTGEDEAAGSWVQHAFHTPAPFPPAASLLSLGRSAESSPVEKGQRGARALVDGRTGSCMQTRRVARPYAVIDLGRAVRVATVIVLNRCAACCGDGWSWGSPGLPRCACREAGACGQRPCTPASRLPPTASHAPAQCTQARLRPSGQELPNRGGPGLVAAAGKDEEHAGVSARRGQRRGGRLLVHEWRSLNIKGCPSLTPPPCPAPPQEHAVRSEVAQRGPADCRLLEGRRHRRPLGVGAGYQPPAAGACGLRGVGLWPRPAACHSHVSRSGRLSRRMIQARPTHGRPNRFLPPISTARTMRSMYHRFAFLPIPSFQSSKLHSLLHMPLHQCLFFKTLECEPNQVPEACRMGAALQPSVGSPRHRPASDSCTVTKRLDTRGASGLQASRHAFQSGVGAGMLLA